MKKSKKSVLALAGLVVAMSSATAQTFTGAFDVGPGGNPQKFNPLTASAGFSFYNKYFSTLTLYDVGLQKISGDLAESWNYSTDAKSLAIKLRKGVKWHDGTPLTARDVKFTLELVRHPDMASVFAARLEAISSIKVSDDQNLVLTLSSPDVSLPDALTAVMILPQHLLGQVAPKDLRNGDWWKSPVGSGPFKWVKYVPDQYVELAANPDFYRGKPKLAKLINRYFKDGSSAAIALQAGEIQHTPLTLDQVRENEKTKAYNVVAGSSHVLNYIGFNNDDPRFKDVRVRQAIMLALDRSAIVKNLYAGNATLASCALTLPKFLPGQLEPYATDLARARQLLSDARWSSLSRGEPIEMLTYYGDQVSKDVLAAVQSMLAQVGVKISPRFVDGATYGQLTDSGKFAMVFAGQGNGPDPSVYNNVLGSAYVPPKGLNRMRISNPEIDKLLEAGKAEVNEGKRTQIYQQLCRATNEQLPLVPLWVANRFGGFGKNVQDALWTPAPGGGRYQDHPENWSLR
ncbi:ABC transporter substrate-binding protein [Herbaspirillum sp.]|uniref:ABC transporter substrate-binding protein n=1 Tax=Herbaspirillum sp. TaxID=1890675 RepID=UPI0031CF6DFC